MYRALLCTLSALVLFAVPAVADDDESPRKIRIRLKKSKTETVEKAAEPKVVVSKWLRSSDDVTGAIREWLREQLPKTNEKANIGAWYADDRPALKGLRDHLKKKGIDAKRLGAWLEGAKLKMADRIIELDADHDSFVVEGEAGPFKGRAEMIKRLKRSPWAGRRMGEPHVEIHRERWVDDGRGWRRMPERGHSPFKGREGEMGLGEIRRLLEELTRERGTPRVAPIPPRPPVPVIRERRGAVSPERAELESIRDELDALRRRLDRALGGEHARREAPRNTMPRFDEIRRRIERAVPDVKRAKKVPAPVVREKSEFVIQGPDGEIIHGAPEEILKHLKEFVPDVDELRKLLDELRTKMPKSEDGSKKSDK